MAVVTDLVAGSGVGGVQEAAGANYGLQTWSTLEAGAVVFLARFFKKVAGASGTTGAVLEAFGQSSVDSATAQTNALTALNAKRRHRYAGSPGASSGATVVNFSDGLSTVPTVDVT
jgi:hypothetical protein